MKYFNPQILDELLSDPRFKAGGVAKLAKISAGALSEIRKGHNEPKANTLGRIASALDKTVDFFYEDDEKPSQRKLPFGKKASNG